MNSNIITYTRRITLGALSGGILWCNGKIFLKNLIYGESSLEPLFIEYLNIGTILGASIGLIKSYLGMPIFNYYYKEKYG